VVKIPSRSDMRRSSNVYTINVPSTFKNSVLEQSQKFGGASHLVTMSLGDLASRMRRTKSKLTIIEELNDYIKLEILLMKRYEEESKASKDSKLSFRIKDELSKECLNIIKKKTGWSTSKAIRIALIWYLYANFDEFVASESFVPLLRCPHCGFKTHDQRALGVHIQELHEAVCPYCGVHYSITEEHSCPQKESLTLPGKELDVSSSQTTIDQFTSVPVSDLELDESKLLQQLGIENLERLKATEGTKDVSSLIDKSIFDESESQLESIKEEITQVGGTLVDLPDGNELKEIIEEREKERKSKKAKDTKIDKLQSEISEILESLREDGLID